MPHCIHGPRGTVSATNALNHHLQLPCRNFTGPSHIANWLCGRSNKNHVTSAGVILQLVKWGTREDEGVKYPVHWDIFYADQDKVILLCKPDDSDTNTRINVSPFYTYHTSLQIMRWSSPVRAGICSSRLLASQYAMIQHLRRGASRR